MILYPTETTYGLGVNVLDPHELEKLYRVKGRDTAKAISWLVRDISDIEQYAHMSRTARRIAEHFLPGPLTLVLPLRTVVSCGYEVTRNTVGFRISPDPHAQALIRRFMGEHNAPLSATSANKSGDLVLESPEAILAQLGDQATHITEVIDDGVRNGTPSTVIRVTSDILEVLRPGAIPESALHAVLSE